jgi:hypothetical protein
MAIARVSHALSIGGRTIGVTLPDIYDNIADAVGVKKQTTKQVVDDSLTVNEARKQGKAILLTVATTGSSHKVLCAMDKVSGAISSLKDRKIGVDTITSARIPRKRRRG